MRICERPCARNSSHILILYNTTTHLAFYFLVYLSILSFLKPWCRNWWLQKIANSSPHPALQFQKIKFFLNLSRFANSLDWNHRIFDLDFWIYFGNHVNQISGKHMDFYLLVRKSLNKKVETPYLGPRSSLVVKYNTRMESCMCRACFWHEDYLWTLNSIFNISALQKRRQ